MSNGLLSNEIRTVVQDRTGFLWIATNNGLQRYDGTHFKTFQHKENDPNSIAANQIWQVLLDRNDNLWVMSYDGQVGLFDKSKFTYTPVRVELKNRGAMWATKRLLTDELGNVILLLHDNEFVTYDKRKKVFSPAANFIPLKPEWKVSDLLLQPGTQKYWLDTV